MQGCPTDGLTNGIDGGVELLADALDGPARLVKAEHGGVVVRDAVAAGLVRKCCLHVDKEFASQGSLQKVRRFLASAPTA